MSGSFYSFSDPLNTGIDFFSPDEEVASASASISITSSINVNFTLPIRSNIAIESNAQIIARKIIFASALLDVDGATLTLSEGIRFASTALSGSVNLEVSALKDAFATTEIAINSNLATNIQKDSFAASVIAINSNVVTNMAKLVFATSNIDSNSNLIVSGIRVKESSSVISIESNAITNITKIAFASTSISASITSVATIAQEILKAQIAIDITSNVVTNITKDAFASSIISSSSTATIVAKQIRLAKSTINSNVNLTIVGKISLATIRINIFNNTNIVAQTIKFSNSGIDFSSIRSLLMLDGVPLTNQNRKLDVSAAPIFVENLNWQGDASRYYKNATANSASKRTFNLQWTFIPNYENKTVDLRASRNFLNRKSKDGDVHTLTILKQDENGTTPYTEESVDVLITNYSENLIRRDLVDDVYYFDCSMSLQEV